MTLERSNVPERHIWVWTEYNGMERQRLYATSVERKAAWRRRHGMAVRPHYPCSRQASRLSSAETAGRPGSGRPGVCGDPAGAPDAGAGRSVLGDGRPDRRQEPRQGHVAPGAGGQGPLSPRRRDRALPWSRCGARAPAAPGAPAPGTRQGHQRDTRVRAEGSGMNKARDGSPRHLTIGACGDL